MTQLEFNEITKILSPNNKGQNLYSIAGITYCYNNHKVILTGNIPKYIIEEIASTYEGFDNFKNQLLKNNINNNYLEKFEINTVEEMVAFSLFMDNYYLFEKTGLIGNSQESYEDITAEIISDMLKTIKPNISIEEWIRINPICSELYFQTQDKINKKPLIKTEKKLYEYEYTKNLKRNLDNFDLNVNPFMDSTNNFKPVQDYLKNVTISIDDLEKGSLNLVITDKKTNTKVIHQRTYIGFYNAVVYKKSDNEEITFSHEFEASINKSKVDGEKIVIITKNLVGDENKITYNLTTNKIRINDQDYFTATLEDKNEIYDEILAATSHAYDVTNGNMINKNVYVKK